MNRVKEEWRAFHGPEASARCSGRCRSLHRRGLRQSAREENSNGQTNEEWRSFRYDSEAIIIDSEVESVSGVEKMSPLVSLT